MSSSFIYILNSPIISQHNLFVKLCCLTCFISRMPSNNDKPFTYEMLPDCTGIRKVARH